MVINQYDGFTDPIKRPWNLLTDLNALMGIVYVHPYAQNTDLSSVPAEDITVTTNDQHVSDGFVDGIDSALRPIIDRGYQDMSPKPVSAKRSVVRPASLSAPAPASSLRSSAAAAGRSKAADPSDHGSHRQRAARH